MNEIIALPRLAELVASVASVPVDTAGNFAKVFFAHIEDVLAVTDSVTIDGLGTFSRSTDTQNPVIYTPSEDLSNALNRPFDMFIPVAIGEAETHSINKIDEILTPPITNPKTSVDSTFGASEPLSADIGKCEKITSQVVENNATTQLVEPAAIPTEDTPPVMPSYFPENSANTTPDNELPECLYINKRNKRSRWLWGFILFLLGLLIGLALGYLYHDNISTLICSDNDNAELGSAIIITDEPFITDTIIPATSSSKAIVEAPVVDVQEKPLDEVYDTVTPNHFLTTMARQYYGPMEYWVFIYEANSDRLGHPNRIKPGTRVLIPDSTTFMNGESQAQTILRAKRMGQEIYDRFK